MQASMGAPRHKSEVAQSVILSVLINVMNDISRRNRPVRILPYFAVFKYVWTFANNDVSTETDVAHRMTTFTRISIGLTRINADRHYSCSPSITLYSPRRASCSAAFWCRGRQAGLHVPRRGHKG